MRMLITSEQALQIDCRTQQIDSVSAESLMDRAGSLTARAILKDYRNLRNVVVLVGPGNNGGDGLVIARHLLDAQLNVTIVCPHAGASELWEKKKLELQRTSSDWVWIGGDELVRFLESQKESTWDLLVDAAFGVGLSRPLNQLWVSVLEFLGMRASTIVAVDTPSGLNGTTGLKEPGVLTCDRTYTMGVAKLGLVIGDGPSVCGKIRVLDIGFSPKALGELEPKISYQGLREILAILPDNRRWESNKSSRGHLLVIAGSPGMEGAGELASLAGARMGAGYVTWARWPEQRLETPAVVLSTILDEDLNFLKSIKRPSALVVGPGLGINDRSRRLVTNIYQQLADVPVVIDADALHLLKLEGLYPVPAKWILTPHTGELAKLLSIDGAEVNMRRLDSVLQAQKQLGGTVLLKGYRSLIATDRGRIFVVGSGGAVLSKAGTGDVLAGMVGGLLASGLKIPEALLLATFIHGRAGDLYAKKWKNDFCLVASDLIEMIPAVLRGLYRRKNLGYD